MDHEESAKPNASQPSARRDPNEPAPRRDPYPEDDLVDDEDDDLDLGNGPMADIAAQAQQLMERLEKSEELERQLAKARSDHARLYADFENYRRRTSQDVLEAAGRGEAGAIEAMLPILDDLTRAVDAGSADPASLLPGLRSVRENFLKTLARLGLEPVPGHGASFDPNLHEALSHVPGDDDGRIVEVFQPGFTLRGKLVRPARVVVARK